MNIIIEDLKEMKKYIQKQINCQHEFKKHGYGYRCKKCKLYTGMNSAWNKYIKENYVVS